jgi:glycosyltransferase involved in cell wall biosynthesis
MRLSVIVPTHNPNAARLAATLAGLQAQSLNPADWELIVIDNGSNPAVELRNLPTQAPPHTRVVRETQIGLSSARARGFSKAKGDLIVLVDDDNVLAPNYLAQCRLFIEQHKEVGCVGGKSLPSFETEPQPWAREFFGLLALRDLGDAVLISAVSPAHPLREYPRFAPIGAGMCLRREAALHWLKSPTRIALSDRKGGELSSSGDNDIVLCTLEAGWQCAYDPALSLRHLIPSSRLKPEYLCRLNLGIQKTWMQVLRMHSVNPWPPLSPMAARLRILKAWFTQRPRRSLEARIRFAGVRGHFEGRVVSN